MEYPPRLRAPDRDALLESDVIAMILQHPFANIATFESMSGTLKAHEISSVYLAKYRYRKDIEVAISH